MLCICAGRKSKESSGRGNVPIIIREHREAPGRKVAWAPLEVKLKPSCRYFIKKEKVAGAHFFFFFLLQSYLMQDYRKEPFSPKQERAIAFLPNAAPNLCVHRCCSGRRRSRNAGRVSLSRSPTILLPAPTQKQKP